MSLVWPNGTEIEPRCTGNYGPRESFLANGAWTRPYHVGADHVGVGTIRAIGAGVVQEAGWGGWAGNTVLIYLGLIDNIRTWVRVAHLLTLDVKVGDEVVRGEALGKEGSTGQSTGVHLHWEIYRGSVNRGSGSDPGSTVDPRTFVRNRLPSAGTSGGSTGSVGSGGGTTPTKKKRRKPMSTAVIYTKVSQDKDRRGAIVDVAAGVFSPFAWFDIPYADGLAVAHGAEKAGAVTGGHYEKIRSDAAAVASRLGKVLVDIDDNDAIRIGGGTP